MSACEHRYYDAHSCVKCGRVPPKAELDVLRAQKLVCTSVRSMTYKQSVEV